LPQIHSPKRGKSLVDASETENRRAHVNRYKFRSLLLVMLVVTMRTTNGVVSISNERFNLIFDETNGVKQNQVNVYVYIKNWKGI